VTAVSARTPSEPITMLASTIPCSEILGPTVLR
jgi:hypothetical protein